MGAPDETAVREIERRLQTRPDLLERLKEGDTSVVTELIELGIPDTRVSVDDG